MPPANATNRLGCASLECCIMPLLVTMGAHMNIGAGSEKSSWMKGVARTVMVLAASLVVASCQTTGEGDGRPPLGGGWQVEEKVDRLTGKPSKSITNVAARVEVTASRYARFAALVLSCSKGKPSLTIGFDFPVGSKHTAIASYRFDSNPPADFIVDDYLNYKILDINNAKSVQPFLAGVASSQVLFVRVASATSGHADAWFSMNGAQRALDALKHECAQG